MVTRAAAETTVEVKPIDPKTLDFDLIIAQARRPKNKPVSIFLRHDLYSEIEDLDIQLDALERKIDGQNETEAEAKIDRSVGEADPVGEIEIQIEELLAKRNPLVDAFNASEVQFEFRMIERGDRLKAKAAMVADKHVPEDDEENEIFPCYMMAQTCVSVKWPGAKWLAFRDQVGEFPFLPLQAAFQESGTAGVGITAPFSRRPSPTRSTGK